MDAVGRTPRQAAGVELPNLGFVAFVTAFIADRFIKTGREVEAREDRLMTKLETIEQRLDRIENRS